tara:strand:- start:709 stop:1143 length:435 start_codon:yes stop_codon:yes gene_type:complete
MKMEAKAQLRKLRVSPRKVRLVVDLVRGLSVKEAILQLQFSKKHAAIPVRKLIESCAANAAHNHNITKDSLKVKTIFVDEGKTLYRWMPRAFGRATPLRKRTCHVTVMLEGDVVAAVEKKKKTKEEKPSADAPVVEAPKEKENA